MLPACVWVELWGTGVERQDQPHHANPRVWRLVSPDPGTRWTAMVKGWPQGPPVLGPVKKGVYLFCCEYGSDSWCVQPPQSSTRPDPTPRSQPHAETKDKTVSETQWSREWGLAAARQITVPSLPQLTLANFEGIVLRLVDICLHALMRPPRTLCRPWFASTPMPGSRLGFGRCRLQHPHSFCPFCRGQHARNRLPLRGTGQHGRCGVGRGSTVSVYARSQVFGI